ncbi:MAG: DUF4402 domain-containing protein [Comamonadaceae bacterium]|nr:MAG: DUF4402 domain-containing protein [Comamonadaceae bacterium]
MVPNVCRSVLSRHPPRAGGASSPGLMGASYSGGLFRLSAEPGTTFSLTAPTGVTMTNGGNNLLVTLVPSKASGSHTMTPGGIDLTYTATVTVNSNTASGIYNGSFQVSIAYN